VGVTALVAMAAAVALMVAGARYEDSRTVVVAGGFALMAALLAVHGLMTPGVLVGMNGLISVTGAATLSVGAAVLALSVLSPFAKPTAIPRVLAVQGVLAVAIVTVSPHPGLAGKPAQQSNGTVQFGLGELGPRLAFPG
jgi:hypothetical protein